MALRLVAEVGAHCSSLFARLQKRGVPQRKPPAGRSPAAQARRRALRSGRDVRQHLGGLKSEESFVVHSEMSMEDCSDQTRTEKP